MKRFGYRWICALLCLACAAPTVPAQDSRAIYGSDDRQDIYEVADPALLALFDAEVALFSVSAGMIVPAGDGYDIDTTSLILGEFHGLCPGERYWDQPIPAECSGFMIGDSLIATAGHCISSISCPDTKFVFGFHMLDPTTPVAHVPEDDVYQCTTIVGQQSTGTDDWAVVRVDRSIVGHSPLPLRYVGSVETDPLVAELAVIGHQAGLPAKVAAGAAVRDATQPTYFEADLDVYAGNSGSAVVSLDAGGGLLFAEGILVRGNAAWIWNDQEACYESNLCSDADGCPGPGWEEVTRSTQFAYLVPYLPQPVGEIPDGGQRPGTPLTVRLDDVDGLVLDWGPSCNFGDNDYVVYEGTLGSFGTHVQKLCSTGGSTSVAFPPPPFSAYYLVAARNQNREGSYGTDGAGFERAPPLVPCFPQALGECSTCAHPKCVIGPALEPTCGECEAAICANDPFCCDDVGGTWDDLCVERVRTVCDSLTCAESQGTCAHPLCHPGAVLTPGCDDPPVSPSCVTAICSLDAYCCDTAWDDICIEEVWSVCFLTCL
jgi:hypothetical protein